MVRRRVFGRSREPDSVHAFEFITRVCRVIRREWEEELFRMSPAVYLDSPLQL